MEFTEAVSQIAAKVKDLKDGIQTEEATKNAFIMPFIGQVLGYDVFNPNEVIPEFTADVGVKKGEKIDYALVQDGQVQILIECKKVGQPLSLENASQLYRYFACTKARIGVLTNGQVWNFYCSATAGPRTTTSSCRRRSRPGCTRRGGSAMGSAARRWATSPSR